MDATAPAAEVTKSVFQAMPVNQIQSSRHQARMQFDEAKLRAWRILLPKKASSSPSRSGYLNSYWTACVNARSPVNMRLNSFVLIIRKHN